MTKKQEKFILIIFVLMQLQYHGATWKILRKEIFVNAKELFLPCMVLLKKALHASQDATP